ncbi:MAG TPA: glycosyltransferase family 4 protein [Candidatus Saccharimonadales bacterium]|nr:glycosyltransferase family 4 protein [Candidatus Saccharimonadales bacterium]
MISFVWPSGEPILAGTGGSETFTAGQVRELVRRGIDVQVAIVGPAVIQSRRDFPDIPFVGLAHKEEISGLLGTVVFINRAYDVPTRHKAAIILHCAVPSKVEQRERKKDAEGKTIIATSVYNAQQWALYLKIPSNTIDVVMPFADPVYGNVRRSKPGKKVRVLYAGRLHPEKGIYTILEMMHQYEMGTLDVHMSIVMAGQHVEEGRTIAQMLKGYKYATLLDPRKTVASMAKLLAKTDILLMPSVFAEPFGMLSVEAQHSGCRVIASSLGGLPETNCGLLTLVEERNPQALITAIREAIALGLSTTKERRAAIHEFTLSKSVNSLLRYLPKESATTSLKETS